MSKSWFFDKDFSGVPDNFFEDTLGCFDFPLEDVEPNGDDGEDWESKFRHLEPPSSNLLTTFSTALCGENASSLEPNYNSCSVLVSFIYYFIHTSVLWSSFCSILFTILSAKRTVFFTDSIRTLAMTSFCWCQLHTHWGPGLVLMTDILFEVGHLGILLSLLCAIVFVRECGYAPVCYVFWIEEHGFVP